MSKELELWNAALYPGTSVLKNKLGIKDQKILDKFEHIETARRAHELEAKPIKGNLDLNHLKAIHKHLFQDVYDWAGETRSVNIAKGRSSFAPANVIAAYADQTSKKLASENNLRGLNKPQFVDRLAHYYNEWNQIHPFREGNGRSTRIFIGEIAKQAGYVFDDRKIPSQQEWNNAAIAGGLGDTEPIKKIFNKVLAPARAVAFDREDPDEAIRKHPELKKPFAELRAAATTAVKTITDPKERAQVVRLTRFKLSANLHEGREPSGLAYQYTPKTYDRGR